MAKLFSRASDYLKRAFPKHPKFLRAGANKRTLDRNRMARTFMAIGYSREKAYAAADKEMKEKFSYVLNNPTFFWLNKRDERAIIGAEKKRKEANKNRKSKKISD